MEFTKRFAALFTAFLIGALLASWFLTASVAVRAQSGGQAKAIPTVTKKLNADFVDGVSASTNPKKNKLLPLDANAKFPDSAIPDSIARTNHTHFGQDWQSSDPSWGLRVTNTGVGDGIQAVGVERGLFGVSVGGDGVAGSSNSGFAMRAIGNASQSRNAGGWAKALVLIFPSAGAGNQYMSRCYNAQQGDPNSTVPCGFTVTSGGVGDYELNFGFKVDDRFVAVSPYWGTVTESITPTIISLSGNKVRIKTYRLTGSSPVFRDAVDAAYFVTVY